ncbi:sulfite reductase, ferredoxin dependent [Candidatus Synechococcus calcipolaris G9]|uniref:assimilatory sulfite reductase (ferredoxin) n=1 Tax=Candidatus Synechococcus calcipolaris G9 TaxID=1497997 RepID=A0ABT6EXI2_9SYNE|nr:sulfite reductase, ferredoxin dependent [Candidatus Synechococcus calcipolaris]MDG2990248.1 sulfite reductase, ferredoxin dependent [Candidatus Synechococcus calcipolaris G9]
MVASPPSAPKDLKLSKLEALKQRSHHLREPVATELLQPTNRFSEDGIQILKFHGSYQQDNRDNRIKGQEKDFQFMLRTRSPAGYIPPELYLTLDNIANEYGNGTLRATTRQGFQLHGILKKNLKAAIAAIVRSMGSTLGACGDLNRNVMAPPAPFHNRPEYDIAYDYAHRLADLLTPQTGAYYEIWLDGEKVISAEEHPEVKAARLKNGTGTLIHQNEEPIYGDRYMPRKFKCCVTVPGDNSVDLFSQDLTLVVITNDRGKLQGFNIFAGGGLGRTHNKEETFARMADAIGYVAAADVYDLVKAIVATQRDYGDRQVRRHARLKYLIHDWGVAKFKAKVEAYFGKAIAPFRPLPLFKYQDFLGWHPQGDGKFFYGLAIANGRVQDTKELRLKSLLYKLVSDFNLPLRVTPNQNVLLCDISPDQQAVIQVLLDQYGVIAPEAIDPLERYAMACPALPTCGLAITESERIIPSILGRLRALIDRVGLKHEHFVVRMTGCPNGCARPYLAELGFVGIKPNTYQTWLGGSPDQTRLAEVYMEQLPIDQLEAVLEPLLVFYKDKREVGAKGDRPESFGDFCHRVGFDALRTFTSQYQSKGTKAKGTKGRAKRYRIDIRDDQYQQLKTLAEARGESLAAVTRAAIAAYLDHP